MNLDVIIDSEGKDHLVFDSTQLYDDSLMGDQVSDFEVLHSLGEGSFGSVRKIRSLKNNKVYALKIVNLKGMNFQVRKYTTREREFLKVLSHPNVIKYYKSFEDYEKEQFYMITELMDNGDLSSLIKIHTTLQTSIKEEMLWNIFLQCISGLEYIHSNGIIHRDIKPENIFMNNKMAIKIGDFGTCALDQNQTKKLPLKKGNELAKNNELKSCGTIIGTMGYQPKEMFSESYDNKVDVYAMGSTFYHLCYLHPLLERKIELDQEYGGFKEEMVRMTKESDKYVNYSKELLHIIDYMIDDDPKKRKTSKELYEMIKYEYSKKYINNTGIESVIRCLYSMPMTPRIMKLSRSKTKPVLNAYLNCLNSINIKEFYGYIGDFRQLLAGENSNLEGNKEVPPYYLLAFLFERLHKELNVPKKLDEENGHKILFSKEASKKSKDTMLINFVEDFSKRFNSIISNYFLGLMLHITQCTYCGLETYSFTNFCFATLNLEKITKERQNEKELVEIDKGLLEQIKKPNQLDLYCPICLDRKIHLKAKKYSILPLCLIIHAYRGSNNQIKTPIGLHTQINLANMVDNKKSPVIYTLIGIITREKERDRYVCYIRNENTKLYNIYNGSEISLNVKLTSIIGEIHMLFYKCIDRKY